MRVLRERELAGTQRETLAEAITHLREFCPDHAAAKQVLHRLRFRFVLTAHPSEAKRQEVLLLLAILIQLLAQADSQPMTPREERLLERAFQETIETLLQTHQVRKRQKTVADEVQFGIYYLTSVIMDVVIDVYDDLQEALEEHFPDENWMLLPTLLTYASWIGGDRDGNPNVTPYATLDTLATMRRTANVVYTQAVTELRDLLTQSTHLTQVSSELAIQLQEDSSFANQYPNEPYRQLLERIRRKLEADEYPTHAELLGDLLPIHESLLVHGSQQVARGRLLRLIRKVRIFGLQLLPLDVREDAGLIRSALDEIFRVLGISEHYAEANRARKK